jgi:DNA-directed RNA polymerase subunit RPC12/RpoP
MECILKIMSDGIIGNATYKCLKCGAKHYLHEEDFHFEAESGSEREMGTEVQHTYEVDEECHNCGNRIQIKFEAWEYPVGILNMTNQDTSGAEILESDFGIHHAPPEEHEFEDSVKLIKSIILFRFDAFAEAFVDLWVKSYKKSPQPTAIISFIGSLLAVLSLGLAIYSSETARTERLESVQSYSEQFNLLKNTERNLNDLSAFITSKKSEIEVTRNVIQELETKKSELEPIVTANQKVVDAIFLQQKKEVEKTIWTERWISFGFGVLASLIATIVWHVIGRFKKGRREK